MSARRAGTDAQSDTGPTYVLDAVDDDVADRILVDAGCRQRRGPPPARRGERRDTPRARRGDEPDRRRPAGRAHRASRSPADRVVRAAGRRPRVRPAAPARAGRPPRGRGRAGRRSRPHRARPRRARARPRRAGGGRGPGGRAARRRSGHLPPPADAFGGVPRRAPWRPAGRPPGARRHAPGRSAGAGVAPGAGRGRAGRGRRPLPRRRRRGDGPTGRADGRRPHVGAGQPVVAGPDRPGPAARAGRRWPPRRRDGGAGRPAPRPCRRGVPRRSERRRRDRAGAPATAPLAPALPRSAAAPRPWPSYGRRRGRSAPSRPTSPSTCCSTPWPRTWSPASSPTCGARSRKRSGCARSSTRNGPGAST